MKSKWTSPRALVLHATFVAWLSGCTAAAFWQIQRASAGNSLSFLYAIEWPVFAIAGGFGWYALINLEKITEGQERARREYEAMMREQARIAREDAVDESPEMAAYNDHLASLGTRPKKRILGH